MPSPIPEPSNPLPTKRKQPASSPNPESSEPNESKRTEPKRSKPTAPTLTLTNHTGDIFSAPPNTLLIHACNTQGSWGAGIAAAFRDRYPNAYLQYRSHCLKAHDPRANPVPTGSCLLIPPCETGDVPRHWIGCLFTSAKYGRAKDRPDVILTNTGPAMRDLLEEVRAREMGTEGEGEVVSGIRMCKINSARFGVPWHRTVEVLEGIVVEEGWKGDAEVWSID
ncbi:uncharacterized protein BDR25DRAFT_256475 [Lindgomyces ingoldianus]|uniref:Uncharacterized protein n=1 Tax=Lindgomyces ingoldianus TaxID=673940 RepID=A0ACB6R5T6_9PLEO|nr:uncharacterized protein BDR25DRAFT_256475 [Lindgomyces ingoldianus]KAF2473662.1 hypothetical protein BDR25DRAFT_256475 [Lindgomyces ingoldianus]